jgi:hypothetical protein
LPTIVLGKILTFFILFGTQELSFPTNMLATPAMQRRIKMTAGLKNKYGPWVSGEDFFNRDMEVRRLTELIDDGNNILVVAPVV